MKDKYGNEIKLNFIEIIFIYSGFGMSISSPILFVYTIINKIGLDRDLFFDISIIGVVLTLLGGVLYQSRRYDNIMEKHNERRNKVAKD